MKAEWTNRDSLTTSQTTKAILVIDDMPTSCFKCKFRDFGKCWASNSYIDIKIEKIPNECPLKPMPKEEDIYEVGMDEEDTNAKRQWNKGWNACLKEICDESNTCD